MNGKDIHDAVEYVGHDLIIQADRQRFPRPFWQTALPVAAMIALLLGVTITLPRPTQPQEPPTQTEVPVPTVPTTDETIPEPEAEETVSIHPLNELFPLLEEIPADAFPEVDWNTFYLNEAGLEDDGTDFSTIHGDQVLAIDAKNGILLIRVKGEDYRGVLAIANDPTRLSLQASSQIGVEGETVGTIAEAHNGVLAINASFYSDDSNGKYMDGYTVCDGTVYNGDQQFEGPYSRLEIDSLGQFQIFDVSEPVGSDVQNALESLPALIVDGTVQSDAYLFSGTHPRSCIGQTEDGTILMLTIEGRNPGYSLGTNLAECTLILSRYGAVQAIGLAYGFNSMLWYDGEYVTKSPISLSPDGIALPNTFVIERAD